MTSVNMLEAKSSLSRLVESIELGRESEIIIARNGRPAAKLVPIDADIVAYETPTQLVIQCERPLRQCVVKGGCVSVTIGA